MRKPDYCPEWFDIDLYDNLLNQPRDALCMALWMRKMNYKTYLIEMEGKENNHLTTEEKAHSLEWLEMLATKWLVPPKNRDSQTLESYNPLAVEQDIIQELSLRNIANLFAKCYLELPQMRELFQIAAPRLDDLVEEGCADQVEPIEPLEQMDWIIKEECTTPESYLDTPLTDVSNYADIFIIELSHSDEVLKMAFEQKLKEIRAKEQKSDNFWNGTRTKRFSDAEIRRIVEYRYFAYIDLYTYSLITGRKFTDVEMAAMIYPPRDNTPLDFDAVDRITRTVRPKAIELFERTNPRLLL